MSWLQCLLGSENNLLHLWKKCEIPAGSNRVRQEQPWRLLNPWLYVMEKNSSRMPNMDLLNDKECTTRLERCCKKLVKKSTEAIHPYLHDGTTATHWVDREGYNATWQNCHGEYVATKAERIWLCSSEKRLQEIARRTHGKDSTRLLNHSSQSTRKDSEKDKSLRELKSDLPTASSTSTNWDGNN